MLSIIIIQAYTQETGRPFIRNYPPLEYRASQQNWAVAQDNRGIVYFGNNDGLLEFDGISWRLIKLPIVRTVAINSLGRIYVGLENDMGFLEPDNLGNYQYYSLKEKIPKIHRDLTTVLYVYILGDQVIYLADDKIFIYQDEQIKVLTSENGFHMIFSVHNRLYVRERGKGLLYLDKDRLRFIEGSELFATERIYSMLPYRQNEILIVTRTQGVFTYSPGRSTEFHKPEGFKEVDNFLLKNPVYCGTILTDGEIAIGTLTGGIIVFNAEGKIKTQFNKGVGLQDNTVYWLYFDNNHHLWAALDNGISLIPVDLPFRYYTEENGLNGSPMCLQFLGNRLYVGTSQYLHVQNKDGNFEQIAGTEGQNFRLFEAAGTMLLADYQGIFEIKDNVAIPLQNNSNIIALTFCSLKDHSGYLLLGSADDGLYLMQNVNSQWKIKHHLNGFNKSVYVAVEDKNSDIWISSAVDLYRLRINDKLDSVIYWKQYKSEHGLPSNVAFPYELNSGEVVFGTEKGVYIYKANKDQFEPHPDFQMLTGKVLPFVQTGNGDIWYEELRNNGNFEKGVLKYINGEYFQYKTPFYKFIDIRCYESPFIICKAPDSTILIGTSSGLLQYDPSITVNFDQTFNTLIRKVFSREKLLFGGKNLEISGSESSKIQDIPYKGNDIIFHFAATFYEDSEKNLFSYRLVGSDTAWSDWVNDHKKEYTNLHEGVYTFEVRSKNQYQKTGSTASYSFIVLPPWYRTWWAYSIYITLAVILVWGIVKINIRRVVKQRDHLEQIVAERTFEIVKQKKQIENAHEEITASINYAKYIQSSVLPKVDQLELWLGDHFILYKPKDIVSGDFYWVSRVDNKTVIVAADCTGHGVPGAFMSMLGITLLNEIVNKDFITNPGVILNRLREGITNSLKQKSETWGQKDGMDIALCTIDHKTRKLQFAGAVNPLYVIRKSYSENIGIIHKESANGNTLIEIKGDRMPIGIVNMTDNFTCHEIDILKGDRYYLFSDGFPDQFGGPEHKKLSYSQFRELLIKITTADMTQQKLMLEKELYEWQGNNTQTDDILVIGFTIN